MPKGSTGAAGAADAVVNGGRGGERDVSTCGGVVSDVVGGVRIDTARKRTHHGHVAHRLIDRVAMHRIAQRRRGHPWCHVRLQLVVLLAVRLAVLFAVMSVVLMVMLMLIIETPMAMMPF